MADIDVPSDVRASLPCWLTVKEAYTFLRIGKTKGWQLVRRYEESGGAAGIPFVPFDRCLRVPRDEFLRRAYAGLICLSLAPMADELASRRRSPGVDGADNDSGVGGRDGGRTVRRPRREEPPDQLPLFPAG